MKVSGIIIGLLSLFLFYIAMKTEGPQGSSISFSTGYNIGVHLPWVITAIISFILLKKNKK